MTFQLLALNFQFRYIRNLINTIVDYANQIKGLFGSFGIIDLIDILFVAIVLYVVIRVIRETRAMQLVKGIIFLGALYVVVNFLGMSASSYIFKEIFSSILIIIVILFGPEIRSILEQMGTGAAKSGLRAIFASGAAPEIGMMRRAIDAVCKACAEMSDDKIGALIAFENETMLGNIIDTGTKIDATPSKALIENIFFPKSPLHDGAMIIRGAKVFAAGCILPLTRDNVASSLGTRHRAAIGLIQESDAIVVIVSEETGSISIAQNGNLQRDISTGDLRDILEKEFTPSASDSNEKILKKFVRRIRK
ncbi:MAG: diadenylate cyclase CdaA [Eubacterium sp.]|nr:diadenylate cyclase CdaA [Eubacterium sp.]